MRIKKLWLTSIAVLLCSITASAHDFNVDGIYYNITSSTDLTVEVSYRGSSSSYYSNEYRGAVTIPSTVTYNGNTYSVTSIGDGAFYECSGLTSITIPKDVTSIGGGAFNGCFSLAAVHICDIAAWCNIKISGSTSNPFCYNAHLYLNGELVTELIIPESVTSIGDYAFYNCSSLTSITIPEGVMSIGDYAFYNCSSLTSITIPESVTSIGEYVFYGCCSLTSITIPEGVTSIGNYAFHNCSSLTAVHISDIAAWCNIEFSYFSSNPLYYANNLYLNGELVTELIIPEGVTSIGEQTFRGCSSLIFITIPEGLTSIEEYAFSGCSSLIFITIPEGVTSIGWGAFEGCCNLTSINIPESVASIETYAFSGCSSLTSITLPEGVTGISECTFENCSSLTTIDIPKHVTDIGGYAFSGCSSLTTITIPEGVTSIESSAFYGCTALKEVIFEDGSETLSLGYNYYYNGTGEGLFYDCPLESVYLGRNLSYSSGSSYGYSPFYKSGRYPTISLGDNITTISPYLFYGNINLTSINIPKGVTSIGERAFYNCSSLYKVFNSSNLSLSKNSTSNSYVAYYAIVLYQGGNLTTIGDYQFYTSDGIHSLVNYIGNDTEIVLPDSFNGENYKIGDYAFYSCSSLTSINIPEGVMSIGDYAFYGCTALKEVIFEDGSETLSLGYNYYYDGTGEGLFYDCPLESVYLGRNLSYSSGSSYGYSPFYNKDALKYVPIGRGVTAIADYAFYGCDNIHSLTIHSGVLSIGSCAFSIPDKVVWLTNTPPTGYVNANGNINYVANGQYTSLSNTKVYPYLSSMFEVDGVKYVPVSPSERTCHAIDCAYDSTATIINVGETASFKGVAMKVTEVMPYTFYDNDHVKEVSVSHLGNLGDYAFYDCDGIEHVTVSHKGDIGYRSFYHCSGIKDVNVANYGYVGSQAFYDCDVIETVDVSNQGYVDSQAFYDCDAIETVNVSSQGYIGSQAFYDCEAIESVTISNQGDIGEQAFYDCNGIKTIKVNNRGRIGTQAFYGCTGMETAIVANLAPVSSSNNDAPLVFADWTSTNKTDGSTSSNTYTFTVKDGTVLSFDWWVSSESGYDKLIATLDGSAILEKSGSLSGTYSNAINQGEHTLIVKYTKDGSQSSGSDQAKVSNIVVSKGSNAQTIAGVGDEAFSGCSSLTTVTLGDSIGSLGNKVFYQCTSLQEIIIPDSVKEVGEYCFSECSAMKSATIGDGVGSIAAYIFENCTVLEDVVVGDGVTAISNYAFTGCSALTNVELGNSVVTINNYAFQNCLSLSEISIPQSTAEIGDYVFRGCTQLSDVIIKDRITALSLGCNGSSALFADCPLDSVYIGGKITYSTSSSYGYSPFYRNTSLRTVVITDREEQVYDNEFYGCTNLQNVTIGNGVTRIGNYAFSGCSSLTGFSFGSSTRTIGDEAFSDCVSITVLISYATEPPICGIQALDDISKWDCTLYVPSGYASVYYGADKWKDFFFIEDGAPQIEYYVLTYMVDGEVYCTETLAYGSIVTMLEEPVKEGYVFSGWDKILTAMPAENVVINGSFTLIEAPTSVNITINQYGCGTYCSEYALNFSEVVGLKAYAATGYDTENGVVTLSRVMTAKAGVGLFIKGKSGEYIVPIMENTSFNTLNMLVGTLENTELNGTSGDGLYANYKFTIKEGDTEPMFYLFADGSTLAAERAYLQIPTMWLSQAESKAIKLRFVNGETTDIGDIESTGNNKTVIYDLMGLRVENPTKGCVYIVNGKKIVY